MAVGKIEYKKILEDADLTPTKLKDKYVSMLKEDDSFGGYNPNWATDPEERYTIMSPESAAAMIASRRQQQQAQQQAQQQTVTTEETGNTSDEQTEDASEEQTAVTYEPIQGGVWPMTIDDQPIVATSNSFSSKTISSPGYIVPKTTFNGDSDFVQQMMSAYSQELQRRGYDPAFAEYLVAQDALESGWGKHQSGKNNFGGIKGKGTSRKTKEWDGQQYVTITSSFRDFDSLQDYVNYKIDLVGNSRYNVFAYSPDQYFTRVKAGGYATDPNYVSKMNKMLTSIRANA